MKIHLYGLFFAMALAGGSTTIASASDAIRIVHTTVVACVESQIDASGHCPVEFPDAPMTSASIA